MPPKKRGSRRTATTKTSRTPTKKSAARKRVGMTATHKAALAAGRDEGAAIRRYLVALESHRPKRGRKRTPQSINRQLAMIDQRMASADPLLRVQLYQQRLDLERELESLQAPPVDMKKLESGFVKAVRPYSERKAISYMAWRAAGVDAAVLQRAGVSRSVSNGP